MNDKPTNDGSPETAPSGSDGHDEGRDSRGKGAKRGDAGSTNPPPTPNDADEAETSADPGEATANLADDSPTEEGATYQVGETQILDSTPSDDVDITPADISEDDDLETPPPARSFIEAPATLNEGDDPDRPDETDTFEEQSADEAIDLPSPEEVDATSQTDIFEQEDSNRSPSDEGHVQSGSDDKSRRSSQSRNSEGASAGDSESGDPESTHLDPGLPEPKDKDGWRDGLDDEEARRASRTANPAPVDDSGGFGSWFSLPDLRGGKAMGIAAGIVVVTVGVALGFAAKFSTSLDAERLTAALDNAEKRRATDSYEAWLNAFRSTATDLSIAASPGRARSTIHWVGELFGSTSPASIRAEIARHQAYYAAVLEYRFERNASRNAAELAEQNFDSDDRPLAIASAIYRDLARERFAQARKHANAASSEKLDHPALAFATLEAALASEDADRVSDRASHIEEHVESGTNYRAFLLARAARFREEGSAVEALRSFLDSTEPPHLGAEIALTEQLHRNGENQKAVERARRLLDRHGRDASDYQRALLKLSLGRAFLGMGESGAAERAFRSAIQIEPGRTSLYLPLLDRLLARGELERAGDAIDRAVGRAYPTAALQLRRARHAFRSGRFQRALGALDVEDLEVEAPILRGRILSRLERHEEAASTFANVDSDAPDYPVARALEALSRTRASGGSESGEVEMLESLLKNSSGRPLLWRTAAELRLTRARLATSEERAEHLDAAVELARRAADAAPQDALNDYLLCECYLARREAASARDACRRGRRKNPHFVPGLITVARLHLALHKPERVELLLDGVSSEPPYDWELDAARARAALQSGRFDDAEKILDRWSDSARAPVGRLKLLQGRHAFATADYRSALDALETVQKRNDDAEARLYYTHALVRLERNTPSAEAALRKLNDHPVWDGHAWLVFGELRRRQGKFGDALENLRYAEDQFETAFTSPNLRTRLYAERAYAWAQQFSWDRKQVEKNVERAQDLDGVTTPELDLLVGLYNLERTPPNIDEAATRLNDVLRRQPSRCRAIRALQQTYHKHARAATKDGRKSIDAVDALAEKHCSG